MLTVVFVSPLRRTARLGVIIHVVRPRRTRHNATSPPESSSRRTPMVARPFIATYLTDTIASLTL